MNYFAILHIVVRIVIFLRLGQVIDELMKKGLLELKDGRLKPTLDGMAVADSLALI